MEKGITRKTFKEITGRGKKVRNRIRATGGGGKNNIDWPRTQTQERKTNHFRQPAQGLKGKVLRRGGGRGGIAGDGAEAGFQ